ncbi:MAG: OmpH family outer membrane protein [Phycisphaerales bacterium]
MQTKPFTAPAFALAIAGAVVTAALFTGAAVATAVRPPAQPTAVAIVDVPAVLDGLKEKERLEANLEQAMQDANAKLQELSNQAEALQAKLDPDTGILKQGTKDYYQALGQLIELQSQAKARKSVLEQTISLTQGEMLRSLYTKIEAGIAKIAEREGYDIVLLNDAAFPLSNPAPANQTKGEILSRSVVYASSTNGIDITADVITLLNNEFAAP